MQLLLMYTYYMVILLTLVIGIHKYTLLSLAFRFILWLLGITVVSEITAEVLRQLEYYDERYTLYHIYAVIQLILLTFFFVASLKHTITIQLKFSVLILSTFTALLNIWLLQPIYSINSNFLILESLVVNTFSLYYIYKQLRSNSTTYLFQNPNIQLAILLLILWSTTFFFWAFIEVLYHEGWRYTSIIINAHIIINILVYAGIAAVFYFYPKKHIAHGNS